MTGVATALAEAGRPVRRHPALALGPIRRSTPTYLRRTGETLCSFYIQVPDLDAEIHVYSTLYLSKNEKGGWDARIHVELPISAEPRAPLEELRARKRQIRVEKIQKIVDALTAAGLAFEERLGPNERRDLYVGSGRTREQAVDSAREAAIVASIALRGVEPVVWIRAEMDRIRAHNEGLRRQAAEQERQEKQIEENERRNEAMQKVATEALRLENEGLLEDSNVLASLRQLVLDLKSVS